MNTFMKSRRLYSNRSASQLALGHNNEGLVDALKARYSANNHDSLIHCVLKRSAFVVARSCSNFLFATIAFYRRSLKPTWTKASYRVGLAYMRLKRFEDAGVAFFDALKLDPGNQTLKDATKNAVDRGREEHQKKVPASP